MRSVILRIQGLPRDEQLTPTLLGRNSAANQGLPPTLADEWRNAPMRCPDCKHNQRYRDGMRCGRCGYQFILRKRDDNFSDHALRQLIQRLSDQGNHTFTLTQLAFAICRYWSRNTRGCLIASLGFVALLSAVFWFLFHSSFALVWISLPLLLLLLWASRRKKSALPLAKAQQLIQRYHQVHPIALLADGQAFRQQPRLANQDLQYAPERILVVERDDLVDLLVRNRFHLAHKTAVMGCSGYPQGVVAACRQFLARYPNLPVYVLHDASLNGFCLTTRLAADPLWPLAAYPLIDLGLSKESIANAGSLTWLPTSHGEPVQGVLSADHAKMLNAGYRFPLDGIPPKSLMNLLGAAMLGGLLILPAAQAAGAAEGGFGVEVDDFG